ncbi:transposase [Flavobacterium oncorhynchi]|uniref:ISAon1 family transposase N-terminal region protein n=1 Tax=Flavobacterium oncorhynchi TaxID=728056 RepID=UPI00351A4115
MNSDIEILKLILPEFLIENFNLTSFKNSEKKLHLYFEEKPIVPKEFIHIELASKGFLNEITIQNFPLGNKFVYLHIKRRRWTNKANGEITKRDWTLLSKKNGTTTDFSTFFKEINKQ